MLFDCVKYDIYLKNMLIGLYHNMGFVNILFDQKSGNRDNRRNKLLIQGIGMVFSRGDRIRVKHGLKDQQFLIRSLSIHHAPVPEKIALVL